MITKDELFKHTENKDGNKVRIDKNIRCSENKSEYLYVNKSEHHVAKIKVDGALISATDTKKCDYLLINWNGGVAFFVELKGSDFNQAISQINATLDLIWSDIKEMGIRVPNARIVLSKSPVPGIQNSPQRRQFDARLKKCGGGKLMHATRQMTETF